MAESRGRPTTYTKEIGKKICEELMDGKTLRAVSRMEGMPKESTIRRWVMDDRDDFYAQYTRAREIGYQSMADELLEITDCASNDWMLANDAENPGWKANLDHMNRSRLRVDTRKWLLSKALPKVYGDKIAVDNKHDISDPMKELLGYVADNGKRLGDGE